MLNDANGTKLTKQMEKDWLKFQKDFDKVKVVAEGEGRVISGNFNA